MVRVKKNYILLIYLYSLVAHIALVFAAGSFAAGIKNSSGFDEAADLSKTIRAPLAFKVSLAGRRGNSYDESKIDAAVKFDEIKKIITRKLRPAVEKFIEARPAKRRIDDMASGSIYSKVATPVENKIEKIVEKKAVVPTAALITNKPAEPRPARNAARKIVNKGAAERNIAVKKRHENSASAEAPVSLQKTPAGFSMENELSSQGGFDAAEVFGNLSGNEKSGSRLAGTPDGQADPALEVKSVDIFKSIVGEKIRSNIKYPYNCRRFGIEGTVRIKFEIAPSGRLASIVVAESSNNSDIDESAIAAVKKSEPFLPYPDSISNKSITFVLPLNYRLND